MILLLLSNTRIPFCRTIQARPAFRTMRRRRDTQQLMCRVSNSSVNNLITNLSNSHRTTIQLPTPNPTQLMQVLTPHSIHTATAMVAEITRIKFRVRCDRPPAIFLDLAGRQGPKHCLLAQCLPVARIHQFQTQVCPLRFLCQWIPSEARADTRAL